MKTFRSHPLLALVPICVGLWFVGAAAPRAAAATPDWTQAAPKPQGTVPDAAATRTAPPASVPAPNRALQQRTPSSFGGAATGRAGDKGVAKAGAAQAAKGLFALDDRAIIIVGGKNTTAGAVKQAINADLAAKAGPPKTVKGGARKPDVALVDATSGVARAKPVATKTMDAPQPLAGARSGMAAQVATASPSSLRAAQVAASPTSKTALASATGASSYSAARCLDKGPPKISEVAGRLKAGGKVTVWGQCFGDRPGRVEIIGQFPGGKLVPAFTAWDMTGIELTIPADIRGAADHVVAVSVVTADGRVTPAAQAKYTAARERIEVPERLWQPGANFELASTTETLNTDTRVYQTNPAAAGQVAKSLRLNPQCALDTMEAIVLSGQVTRIRGWEDGPPNEAQVAVDWVGTCTSTTTTTSYHYVVVALGDDISITSACRIAFQARAWAYCPVGVAP